MIDILVDIVFCVFAWYAISITFDLLDELKIGIDTNED